MLERVLTLVFSGVSALTILFLAVQTYYMRKQIDYAKKQIEIEYTSQIRQNTIDAINKWVNSFMPETSSVWHFVSKLSEDQCVSIKEFKSFKVDERTREYLDIICKYRPCEDKSTCQECKANGCICEQQVANIRWIMNYYLNSLETVMCAWRLGTVDSDTIEAEFSDLYSPIEQHDILKNYRTAKGGIRAHPAINEFYVMLDKKYRDGASPKPVSILAAKPPFSV